MKRERGENKQSEINNSFLILKDMLEIWMAFSSIEDQKVK